MEMIGFAVLAAINLTIIGVIIRRRTLFSSEGWCALFLLAISGTDALELLFRYCFIPEAPFFEMPGDTWLGAGEFDLRMYPTLVHIIGMCSLLAGILVVDRRTVARPQSLSIQGLWELRRIAVSLWCVGASLYGAGLVLNGVASGGWNSGIAKYRQGSEGLGTFWYQGMNIMLMACLLMFLSGRGPMRLLYLVIAAGGAVVGLANKGGLERIALFSTFLCYAFRPRLFDQVVRRPGTWIIGTPVLIAAVLLIIGGKNLVRSTGDLPSIGDAIVQGVGPVRARYSSDGLYRGFALLVTNMREGYGPGLEGRALKYTFEGWVPRILFPNKPDNPFGGTGALIYQDHHVYIGEGPAPTFVGFAYIDGGLWCVIAYLGGAGVLLGFLRKFAIDGHPSLYRRVGYAFFCLYGACSWENGLLDIWVGVFFSIALMLVVRAITMVLESLFGRSWAATASSNATTPVHTYS